MPMSAEATAPAMPATVAWAAVAGPAANGPMIGARKPNTPAKASAAEDRIERTIVADWLARDAAAPACSAPVRAVTPALVAAVFAASVAIWRTTVSSPHSMNLISRSSSVFLNAVCQLSVPDSRPCNCELNAWVTVLPNAWYSRSCSVTALRTNALI
jgi:hypothetical protein